MLCYLWVMNEVQYLTTINFVSSHFYEKELRGYRVQVKDYFIFVIIFPYSYSLLENATNEVIINHDICEILFM